VSYALGFAELGLRKPGKAAESWERVKAAVPAFVPVYLDLADAYLQMGNPGQAVETLRAAEQRWPKNIEVLNALGTVQVRRGSSEDAIATFERAIAAAPKDSLAYLNAAAGGSEAGPRVTDESNVDWGQELLRLAAWQRARMVPGEPLRLFYFGSAVPEVYGVLAEPFDLADAARPRRGTYAISAHYLAYFRKLEALEGADVDWLDKYEPVARIGHSIYVYRFEQDAPAPEAPGPASLP
jgi:tetratricopeptide (TPR) repeat protein